MVIINSRKLASSFLLLLLLISTQLSHLCFQFCYSLPWLWSVGFYWTPVCDEAWLVFLVLSHSFELIEWLIWVHRFRQGRIQHTPKLFCPCLFLFQIGLILILEVSHLLFSLQLGFHQFKFAFELLHFQFIQFKFWILLLFDFGKLPLESF